MPTDRANFVNVCVSGRGITVAKSQSGWTRGQVTHPLRLAPAAPDRLSGQARDFDYGIQPWAALHRSTIVNAAEDGTTSAVVILNSFDAMGCRLLIPLVEPSG
jgi:hypothetical protein